MQKEIEVLTEEIKLWRDGQDEHIKKLDKILLGNGGVGLCERVRQMSGQMKALWTLVSIVGFSIIGGIIKLLFFT